MLALAAAAMLLAGCAGSGESRDSESGGGESGGGATTSITAAADSTTSGDAQAPPEQLVIDIAIEGGAVTPVNARFQAAVGEPIELRVNSDMTDELHVHSTPEHSFDVGIGPAQTFRFTVEVPGRVDIELHELHKTVATIQVQ
ncbi:hypothetical protein [Mycolicibacterium vaccae]|uniref:EfeO-type cupredoxin-like domain-containing protein n=1 Tax=Mycolicibacterium vaccae ATCC 25954 TaxID=1194972 RepID=K0V060_MYCVA|nr:hypothetical protein [Mycolicibacterium vaccae]ANI42677.1 hypothetical protein MYVA_5648 [Mycolicibacterium vaccae 95051]EJZ10735.1 hypothetical protein MVAC_08449 [Mycolicibacterium vaccae ATCC 25954]MCV7060927.1 hypothetical protein [Mycolicibacterium vaccae]